MVLVIIGGIMEDLFDHAFEFSKSFKRISSCLLQRKFKITHVKAKEICNLIRLHNWKEAREEAKKFYGMD